MLFQFSFLEWWDDLNLDWNDTGESRHVLLEGIAWVLSFKSKDKEINSARQPLAEIQSRVFQNVNKDFHLLFSQRPDDFCGS